MTPDLTVSCCLGAPHCSAAASIRRSRALAPACCRYWRLMRTELLELVAIRPYTLFSRTWRFTDAYSARTFDQSHSSSSTIIFANDVNVACPISDWATRIVTVSSGATTSHGLI